MYIDHNDELVISNKLLLVTNVLASKIVSHSNLRSTSDYF